MRKNFVWAGIASVVVAALFATLTYAVPDADGNPGGLITGQRFLVKIGKQMFNATDALLTTGSSGLITNVVKQTGAVTLGSTTFTNAIGVTFGASTSISVPLTYTMVTITDKNDQVVSVITAVATAQTVAVPTALAVATAAQTVGTSIVGGSVVVTNVTAQRVP